MMAGKDCEGGETRITVIDRNSSRLAQIDAADPQFYEDEDQVTFDASSPGNQAIQCAPQPAGPSGDVLPNSPIKTLNIKDP